MGDTANSNAGLMRRIVQLEKEKDELQRDVETLCMQKSGFSGGIDVVSRMQSRRAAGFEQELEACKQKLAFHAKENLNLQEEVTEVHRAKGRVADAFKASMDKNSELEKEVKFYQSRMAGAFSERDKAVLEVENLRASEKTMAKDLRELHHRLEETKEQFCEQENSFNEVQQRMEASVLDMKWAQKVVDKFWQISASMRENEDVYEESIDKAQILLDDNDTDWVYNPASDEKDCCKTVELALAGAKDELETSKAASLKLEEALLREQSASTRLEYELALLESASTKMKDELMFVKSGFSKLQEELQFTKASAIDLKCQLEKEHLARVDAEEMISMMSDQAVLKQYTLAREAHQLHGQQVVLRKMVSAFLDAEKIQLSLLEESVRSMAAQVNSQSEQPNNGVSSDKSDDLPIQDIPQKLSDDSREILAQALQEKVEALLLLSQQEERYYLEASTQSALESQVTELNQKLAQVTGEKVKALLELADEKQQMEQIKARERELNHRLEQHRVSYPGGGLDHGSQNESRVLSPAGDSSPVPALEDKPVVGTKQRFIASGAYLKGWLRGLDMSGLKTTSTVSSSNSSVADGGQSITNDGVNNASRAPVEDAALQERVASLQHLAKSAHRLRMILVRVASESQGECGIPFESAVGVIESVKSEAKQLSLALGCALPVSQGPLENNTENSMEASSEEIMEGNDGEVEGTNAVDVVPLLGIEITELLLSTADLQVDFLRCRLESATSLE